MTGTTIRSFTIRVRSLSLFDQRALLCLAAGNSASTCFVARDCGFERTSIARTLLRRLERWGLAEGTRAPSGGAVRWWRITDAGRRAIGGAA